MITFAEAHRLFDLDVSTGALYWRINASASARIGQRAGCLDRSTGYWTVRYRGNPMKAHQVIWLVVHGSWPSDMIDHINRDKSDNRPENLRAATLLQNNQNRPMQRSNKSGVSGVYWSAEHRKWKAQISVNGKRLFLGLHDSIDAARDAKVAAETQHFGAFSPSATEFRSAS